VTTLAGREGVTYEPDHKGAWLLVEGFLPTVEVKQGCIREGVGTGQGIDCPVCRWRPDSPVDEIILKEGTPADIDSVVAGVAANACADAVLHYGNTTIVLTGYRPIDVQDYWFKLG
jgi:hypothetical protein